MQTMNSVWPWHYCGDWTLRLSTRAQKYIKVYAYRYYIRILGETRLWSQSLKVLLYSTDKIKIVWPCHNCSSYPCISLYEHTNTIYSINILHAGFERFNSILFFLFWRSLVFLSFKKWAQCWKPCSSSIILVSC